MEFNLRPFQIQNNFYLPQQLKWHVVHNTAVSNTDQKKEKKNLRMHCQCIYDHEFWSRYARDAFAILNENLDRKVEN